MELFIDRETINWGQEWRKAIQLGLKTAIIFVPVLTPNYFNSQSCRNELNDFLILSAREEESKLILPLMYVEIPELMSDRSEDSLVNRISELQVHEWGGRFFNRGTGAYRKCVNELATRLCRANEAINARYMEESREAEEKESTLATAVDSKHASNQLDAPDAHPTDAMRKFEEGSEDSGLIDSIATFTEIMTDSTDLLNAMCGDIAETGEIANQYTEEIDELNERNAKPVDFAFLFKRMGKDLSIPADSIYQKGQELYRNISAVNTDALNIIGKLQQFSSSDDAMSGARVEFENNINVLVQSSQQARSGLRTMDSSLGSMIGISRDLNTPLKRIQAGIHSVLDACNLIDAWKQAI